MIFETTIYGSVEIPIADEGRLDFLALKAKNPTLKVEVERAGIRFLLPLRVILMDDAEALVAESCKPNIEKIGTSVRFG